MDESTSRDREYLVSLNAITKDPHLLSKVAEVFARAGSGLTLEGLTINMNMAELEPTTEGVEDPP